MAVTICPICVGTQEIYKDSEEDCKPIGDEEILRVIRIDVDRICDVDVGECQRAWIRD
jgi:hypothetical protein